MCRDKVSLLLKLACKVRVDVLKYMTILELSYFTTLAIVFYQRKHIPVSLYILLITFSDHAEFHSLQGVDVKIGEKFRPPKKV